MIGAVHWKRYFRSLAAQPMVLRGQGVISRVMPVRWS